MISPQKTPKGKHDAKGFGQGASERRPRPGPVATTYGGASHSLISNTASKASHADDANLARYSGQAATQKQPSRALNSRDGLIEEEGIKQNAKQFKMPQS